MIQSKTLDFKIKEWVKSKYDLERINENGVYKIFHIKNKSALYIGSTFTKRRSKVAVGGFYIRWNNHLKNLKKNKHHSKKLQYLVNMLGIKGIRFSILEICDNKESCINREQFYFDNIRPDLNTFIKSDRPNVREVYQFSKHGQLIKKFESLVEAAKSLSIDRGSINNVALNKRRSAGGYIWSFSTNIDISGKYKLVKYDLQMNKLEEYDNMSQAAKLHNKSTQSGIGSCVRGKTKQAYGFIWKREKIHDELSTEQLLNLGLRKIDN